MNYNAYTQRYCRMKFNSIWRKSQKRSKPVKFHIFDGVWTELLLVLLR